LPLHGRLLLTPRRNLLRRVVHRSRCLRRKLRLRRWVRLHRQRSLLCLLL
jgi:hypothetical protein